LVRGLSVVCAEWSVEVIEVLPFAQFGFEIGIAFVAEQLVELLPVSSVRSFHFAVELWRAPLDVGVANAQIFYVPM
jgi:hypothetical protein